MTELEQSAMKYARSATKTVCGNMHAGCHLSCDPNIRCEYRSIMHGFLAGIEYIQSNPETKNEHILCSAVKRTSSRNPESNPPYWPGTNDIMDIELGYRHHDIFNRFGPELSKKPDDQGFYTSKGRFVNRTEGMKIAYESNQVNSDTAINQPSGKFNKLMSEDLY